MNLSTMRRCFRGLRTLGIFWMLLAMPLGAGTVRVYITNHAGRTIQVVDPATNKVVQVIKDIEAPEAVDFSPDGSRIYITQGGENVLTVLDRKTGKQIKKVPISGHANDMTATKDGRVVLGCINDDSGARGVSGDRSPERG